jgi:hypothetical protein
LQFNPAHVTEFANKSITSDDFVALLYKVFDDKKQILDSVDWKEWFHGQGMYDFF